MRSVKNGGLRLLASLLLACLCLGGIGCGDDAGGDSGGAGTPGESSTPAALELPDEKVEEIKTVATEEAASDISEENADDALKDLMESIEADEAAGE